MVDASQFHTNDQYNRKSQLYGQFGAVAAIGEWYAKTAHTFDDDSVCLIADFAVTRHDVMVVDDDMIQFRRKMGSDRGFQQIGRCQRKRKTHIGRFCQRVDVFVMQGTVEFESACSNRFIAATCWPF